MDADYTEQLSWLFRADLDARAVAARDKIGEYLLDAGPLWYTEEVSIRAFCEFLGQHDSGKLGGELEDVVAYPAVQCEWLEKVVRAVRYTPSEVTPEYFDMYRRYDKQEGVFEWYDPADPNAGWMSQAMAEAKIARLSGEQKPQAPSSAAEEVTEPPWTWDSGWEMFYRVTADGDHQFAHAADESRTTPVGPWLTYEQAMRQRQRANFIADVNAVASTTAAETSAQFRQNSVKLAQATELTAEEIEEVLGELARDAVTEIQLLLSNLPM